LAITQGTNYTFIHTGFLRTAQAPAHDVWMIGDTPPTPAAGQIGVRIIHAGAALGNIDINIQRHPVNAATVDSLPDTPLVANVAYGTVGTYLTLPFDSLPTDSARVVITAAGSKVPIASILLPAGVVGTSTTNPIAGSRIVGSVMTGVIVPPSVGGSHAPQGGAFVNPGVVVLVDRRPPNTAP